MNFRLYLLTREIFRLKATKEKSKILTWSNRKWRSVEVGAQSDSIVAHIQCTCPVSQRWRSFNARAQPLAQQVALCQCKYPVSQRWRSFNVRTQPLTQQVALCQCTYPISQRCRSVDVRAQSLTQRWRSVNVCAQPVTQ